MLKLAVESGEKNKIIPGWVRALIVVPCLGMAVLVMILCGNIYNYVSEIQIGWFDKYYLIVTALITVAVYLFILFICLVPAMLIIRIVRPLYEKNKKPSLEK